MKKKREKKNFSVDGQTFLTFLNLLTPRVLDVNYLVREPIGAPQLNFHL